MSSPLSWTAYAGLQNLTRPSLNARVDALRLRDPSSDVSRKAVKAYLTELNATVARISAMGKSGADLSTAPLQFPAFPDSQRTGGVPADAIPTETYNWCVSPFVPMAVAGVIWVPGEANIGHDPADYAAELEAFANSLPATFGRENIRFLFAQPTPELVKGITAPNLPAAKSVPLAAWPKSLRDLAIQFAKMQD
jgi:hypothetical protein